jgi:hypothetical protein
MRLLPSFGGSLMMLLLCGHAYAQHTNVRCKPVSERTADVGCWIIANQPVGKMPNPQAFWYLDTYPTRTDGEAARSSRGVVLESFGKIWLLTIEDAAWKAPSGGRIRSVRFRSWRERRIQHNISKLFSPLG